MVTTPEKTFRTPPTSRGTSPSRIVNTGKRNTPNSSPSKSKTPPTKGILKKGTSPERKNKPNEKLVNGKVNGINSSKVQEHTSNSRDSE